MLALTAQIQEAGHVARILDLGRRQTQAITYQGKNISEREKYFWVCLAPMAPPGAALSIPESIMIQYKTLLAGVRSEPTFEAPPTLIEEAMAS